MLFLRIGTKFYKPITSATPTTSGLYPDSYIIYSGNACAGIFRKNQLAELDPANLEKVLKNLYRAKKQKYVI